MTANKKRFSLDMDVTFQRRLKAIAALQGVSMRQYCISAIERAIAKDEVEGALETTFNEKSLNSLLALQDEIFQGRELPGDSADFIREAREKRSKAQ